MKAYLRAFVNFEQNDWARLFLIAEFIYNNTKKATTGHIFFEFNYGYYPRVSYEKNLDLCSKLRITEELSFKL